MAGFRRIQRVRVYKAEVVNHVVDNHLLNLWRLVYKPKDEGMFANEIDDAWNTTAEVMDQLQNRTGKNWFVGAGDVKAVLYVRRGLLLIESKCSRIKGNALAQLP